MTEHYDPITPGEYLDHEFLEPLNISQSKLARDIDVPISRINGIIKGTRAITADTALRFAEYFNTSPGMWLNLQTQYDIRVIKRKNWNEIKSRIRPLSLFSENGKSA
ncbi:HigA family addiction module antitoxin [Candidatus Trichorickettsia mobilis]|uniref:HigA family addiction module antitoxin n=1 Tax=Candidatus Trichorickettsia mobilis TaxID=1346319 RepID=UPI0029303E78|nr:HigA family addiction module antitoxin [Candidatus Trichorickettsia mobilis]